MFRSQGKCGGGHPDDLPKGTLYCLKQNTFRIIHRSRKKRTSGNGGPRRFRGRQGGGGRGRAAAGRRVAARAAPGVAERVAAEAAAARPPAQPAPSSARTSAAPAPSARACARRGLARQRHHAAVGAGKQALAGTCRSARGWSRRRPRASPPGRWRRRSRRRARPCRRGARSARSARASWRIPATPAGSSIARAAGTSARTAAIRRRASSSTGCWPRCRSRSRCAPRSCTAGPRGALERGNAPVAHLVEVDVERRLVELDHVDACGLDLARLGVEDLGEGACELLAAAIVGVEQRVDHRHRAGQRELDAAVGGAAQERGILDEHGVPARDGPGHHRHLRVVAVADAHGPAVGEVDAVELLDEVVTKWRRVCSPSVTMSMPARSCSRSTRRTASRLPSARSSPSSFHGAQSVFGGREPGRLGQAAGDGGREQMRHGGFSGRAGRGRTPRRRGCAMIIATRVPRNGARRAA